MSFKAAYNRSNTGLFRLSAESIAAIWEQYDADGSNSLDKRELKAMLVDLTQLRSGCAAISPISACY